MTVEKRKIIVDEIIDWLDKNSQCFSDCFIVGKTGGIIHRIKHPQKKWLTFEVNDRVFRSKVCRLAHEIAKKLGRKGGKYR